MKYLPSMKWAALLLLVSGSAHADDFDRLWTAVQSRSPALRAEANDRSASELLQQRTRAHWAPRLLLNAGLVSTNDPTTTLFSTLGSRTLQASDLSPDLMNEPSREWFKRGSLVLDWAIFEGGARSSVARGSSLLAESQSLSASARKNEIYAELVRDYAKLGSLREEKKGMLELKEKLARLIDRYRVGSQDNPVGYSGLLGLRSLLNRLEGLLDKNAVETGTVVSALQLRSGLEGVDAMAPAVKDPIRFVQEKLSRGADARTDGALREKSMRLAADAQAEFAKAERARWLPRIGAFASGSLVSGPRDSGISTEYGAYLQWELLNATHWGAEREASLRAQASQERASEISENSRIARESLKRALPMLEMNLKRIRDSMAITTEQVAVTERLFRSGSVNALQLTEVLSRRADVIESHKELEVVLMSQWAEDYLQNVGIL